MKRTEFMSLSMACLLAFAAGSLRADTCVVDGVEWSYTVSGGVASLGEGDHDGSSAVPFSTKGALVIPSELGGVPVTSIGRRAFSRCGDLTSIAIPSSVTNIAIGTFSGCGGQVSFSVDPANPNYSSVNGLLCSKDGTALICGINGNVTIPSSVTGIGDMAFANCGGLTSVTIPSSVTNIGACAFAGCGLTSVSIPSSVKEIRVWAFFGCSGLTSFSVDPANPNYSSVNGLLCSKDGRTLFAGVNGEVTIPSGVTRIVDSAFFARVGLMSVTIPSSVTRIGEGAFSCCGGLMSFGVDPANPNYSSVNGLLCSKDGRTLFAGVNGEVTIPSGVTSIEDAAFSDRRGLTSVTIPSSVTSIGVGAFEVCSGLTSVTIPSGVTRIGERAFHCCSELTSVTIPSSVTRIDGKAFDGCPLKRVLVAKNDEDRVKKLLEKSGELDVSGLKFVEMSAP